MPFGRARSILTQLGGAELAVQAHLRASGPEPQQIPLHRYFGRNFVGFLVLVNFRVAQAGLPSEMEKTQTCWSFPLMFEMSRILGFLAGSR